MAEHVTCPGCQRRLRIPAGSRSRWLTCPRCLASIANPNAPASPEATRAEPPAPPTAPEQCPHCGRPVQPVWRFCPHCEEPLVESRRRWVEDVDTDVRRDSKGTGCGLIVLAAFGGLGLAYVLMLNVAALGVGDLWFNIATAVCLLVLVGISTAIVMARGASGRPFVGRVLFGTLALTGGLILLLIAVLFFAFLVCLGTGVFR